MDEERIALRFEEGELRRGRSRKLFRKTFGEANLVRLHYHESLELNICSGLRGSAWIEGRRLDLSGDRVLVLRPRSLHSYAIDAGPGSMEILHLSFAALAPWLDAEALAGALSDLPPTLDAYRDLIPLVRSGTEDETDKSAGAPLRAAAFALSLVAALRDAAASAAAGTGRQRSAQPDDELRSLIAYAERRIAERRIAEGRSADPPSLAEAAAKAGRSRSAFCRWFRTRAGTTWRAYVETLRLGAARERMAEGMPVWLAASESGYDDPSYFVRRYKACYGETPGKERRRD